MAFAATLPICLALEMSLPVVALCSQTMVFVVHPSAGGDGLPVCVFRWKWESPQIQEALDLVNYTHLGFFFLNIVFPGRLQEPENMAQAGFAVPHHSHGISFPSYPLSIFPTQAGQQEGPGQGPGP